MVLPGTESEALVEVLSESDKLVESEVLALIDTEVDVEPLRLALNDADRLSLDETEVLTERL